MRELTSMQAACWMGRHARAELGGVAAHLYAEFEGCTLEPQRLRGALEQLYRRHPMLSLRVDAEGRQAIAAAMPAPLEVEDLREWPARELQQHLLTSRERWTHQTLDLGRGQAARWCLSLLPGGRCRLQVDTDMIAIDPSSFRTLIEDLAQCYEDPHGAAPQAPAFFDWYDKARSDPARKAARERSRRWWRERLASIAPAPALPLLSAKGPAHSHRLAARLTPFERQALRTLAREQRITFTTLMLGLFAAVLAERTGDHALRLNVPSFWREPLVEDVERVVGEFANVLIVDAEVEPEQPLAALCRQLAGQMIERLGHSAYCGVDLMRDLSRHHGSAQLAPVVFTAALDLPDGELFSPRVTRVLGALEWVVSQGPQVALDAQIACAEGGILINWDVRLDALSREWVTPLFERFVGLTRQVAANPALLQQPLARSASVQMPLNALQQAYLLGRSTQLPLGGVAMQEFREYRGRLALALLRSRLDAMVRRHASLRTHIDAQRLVQTISDLAQLNLQQVDLSGLSEAQALSAIADQREAYAHALCPFERSPWDVTAFSLADGTLVVFVRFDALILDGRAIAALAVELFEGRIEALSPPQADAPARTCIETRKADIRYWKDKLAPVTGAPRLPWSVPLEQLGTARYQRQSLRVDKTLFAALCKRGAQQRLFKNSTVMAVVLEVLGHWLEEGDVCVAVPVAVPTAGTLANRSSFLAVNWQPGQGSFAERAARLQVDVLEGLDHLGFSGVDLARLLFESHGPGPALPVVITNGLSWPVAAGDSPMRLTQGLTQTPQVAIDIRFSSDATGDLLFDIDYARQALPAALVGDLLAALGRAVQRLCEAEEFALGEGFIEPAHYAFNQAPEQARALPFLSRIACHLLDRDTTHIALVSAERRISYAELGEGVGRIIAAFKRLGVSRGKVVAVCLPRSPEHTQVILACALAGVIWVPIDAQAPDERRQYLLRNCRPRLVVIAQAPRVDRPLHDSSETHDANALQVVSVAELLAVPAPLQLPADLDALSLSVAPAYYLYTSGTTGQPKCVVLGNQATANVIGSTLEAWAVDARDVFISVTPLHHDMSVFDVLGCLTAGATLVLPGPGEEKDALHWHQLVARHQVTLWCSVPAILEMLLACRGDHDLRSLRLIAQGGDYIKPAVIGELRALLPQTRLVSLGGPTETTIWSIWHEISRDDQTLIPYGRPLPGNRYLVLDAQGEHCPTGVVGRIHTAGVNLALGYLDDGTLAQTDFVTVRDDHGHWVRALRTGDCGRYRRDGSLLFARRVNGYVKVRGVRISLPDVEMVLNQHSDVQHVLVVDYGDQRSGETCIGALYVSRQALPSSQLRDYARAQLAQSHVPTRLVAVDALPLTANGKPDRARARSLLTAPIASAVTCQRQVIDIYLDVLGRRLDQPVDERADFIGLGLRPQHLKALSARLQTAFSVALSPGQLLRWRNADEVATYLQQHLGNQFG